MDDSEEFDISAGVRQGCVLSPRLFCGILRNAMKNWRRKVETYSFDLGDGLPPLLDLRFSDDIHLFGSSSRTLLHILDELINCLANVGLHLNASKTVFMTTEAQPPPLLTTKHGAQTKVLEPALGHKWLGCILTAKGSQNSGTDSDHHLAAATRAFHASKEVLCGRKVSVSARKKFCFFNVVVTTVVSFGAGPRAVHMSDFAKLNFHFWKLARFVVGPPAGVDWTHPWHQILALWDERVDVRVSIRSASVEKGGTATTHWNFAKYMANLPGNRRAKIQVSLTRFAEASRNFIAGGHASSRYLHKNPPPRTFAHNVPGG